MAKGENFVWLKGNLTKDPELRYTQAGVAVATISLATNTESRKKPDGEWEDLAQFHRAVLWGPGAEALAQAAGRGDAVELVGMLTHRKYQDAQGQERYITEVKCSMVKHRPKRDGATGGGRQGAGGGSSRSQEPPPYSDSDIPF